jgi:hypothetical protein
MLVAGPCCMQIQALNSSQFYFPTKLGVHSDLCGCVPGKLGASMQAFCSSALLLLLLMQKSCRPFRRVFEKDDKRSSTALGTGSCMQSYPVVPF